MFDLDAWLDWAGISRREYIPPASPISNLQEKENRSPDCASLVFYAGTAIVVYFVVKGLK